MNHRRTIYQEQKANKASGVVIFLSLLCVPGIGSCFRRRLPPDRATPHVLPPETEGAERRKAQPRGPRLVRLRPCGLRELRRARSQRRARRLSALHRGDFGLRDRASGGGRRTLRPPDPAAFAAFVLPASSHRRQTHVVGSDGYPRPPGPVCARHRRGRRHPRSANRTPPEGALGEQGWREYNPILG
jgi:hypothetical protein